VLDKPAAHKDLVPSVLAFGVRSLATGLRSEKRFAEAERYFARLVPLVLVAPGEGAQQTRVDIFLLGDTYASQGKYAESERAFAQLVDVQRRASCRNLCRRSPPPATSDGHSSSRAGWQMRSARSATRWPA
jgi:hypothetical protein